VGRPKGPSLDPDDKRLAMQVEDHPVSYFSFEGIIPAGNYGAARSWSGTSPMAATFAHGLSTESSFLEQTKKRRHVGEGRLKFRLNGKKLQGDFAIIRMRSRRAASKGNEWLLIKKRDDQAEEGYDAEQYDNSALTNRTMREIAASTMPSGQPPRRPKGRLKAAWLAMPSQAR